MTKEPREHNTVGKSVSRFDRESSKDCITVPKSHKVLFFKRLLNTKDENGDPQNID